MGQITPSPILIEDAFLDRGSAPGFPHRPFFAALASMEGREQSPEWHATVAGLLALRLVDERIGSIAAATTEAVSSASAALVRLNDRSPLLAPLRGLVDAIAEGERQTLTNTILAYARSLHAAAQWPLAADAYLTALHVASSPRAPTDGDVVPLAPLVYNRLGRSLRMMGDLAGAAEAYATGRSAARSTGDRNAELRFRIAEARLMLHVGNLPAARMAFDTIIREADESAIATGGSKELEAGTPRGELPGEESESILAMAHHDRGLVASMQGDCTIAIDHYFTAWRAYRDPAQRERVWLDMARTFGDMGLRDTARDAHLALARLGRFAEIRLIATTNLLELAVLDGRPDEFAQYQRTVHDADADGTLPAWLSAWVALYEAQGQMRFGQLISARASVERALSLATRYRVNEVILLADEVLGELNNPSRALQTSPPTRAPTAHIERIIRAIRRIRVRAESRRSPRT